MDYGEGLPLFPALCVPSATAHNVDLIKGILCEELRESKLKYPNLVKPLEEKVAGKDNVVKYLITDGDVSELLCKTLYKRKFLHQLKKTVTVQAPKTVQVETPADSEMKDQAPKNVSI